MPSRKRSFTNIEFAAGAMVITSAIVLALFVALIKGLRPPEKVNTFRAYFTDTAGLNVGGDVRFGGVKAGRVVHIKPDAANQAQVEVTFAVRPDFPINAESRAFITQTTLTAEPHLEITTGGEQAARLKDGAAVPKAEAKGGGMFGGIDEIAASLTPVLADVRTMLGVEALERLGAQSGENGELVTIADILGEVDSALVEGGGLVKDVRGVVAENARNIESILTKVEEVEDAARALVDELNAVIAENRPDIAGTLKDVRLVVANVAAVSEKLDALERTLQDTLNNAEALSENAQGMLEQNRPAIEDIVLDLRETIRQLKVFARIITEEPESVIRGKTPHGRK
ncbi:MAG TPA: MCE family protein [Candidatus Hydrogenedentes bacterium]|nr:MCE family protein [Candidatus Hydrogenedentota bacterium]